MAGVSNLIRTKLHAPPVGADTVGRDALYARLEAEGQRPLCLVSAPAGYGKSTTISDWLRRSGRPHAWLSLDARDNDLRLFLSYVLEALGEIQPSVCPGTAALLEAATLADPERLATMFVNELADLAEQPVLVLDDYHRISATEIHEFVWRVVEHPPVGFRLVLTCRRDPPLPLVRLRANARLTELRARDLRFDLSEATRFFALAAHREVPGSVLESLHRSTEGWAAGLRLAAAILRDRPDSQELASGLLGEQQNVREYLMEEVFAQQTPALQACLLELSILERFSADLAREVLSAPPPVDLLETIERAGIPIVRLDDRGHWLRFHHLFGHFLQRRLSERGGPAGLAARHRRAAAALEARGLLEEAFDHALQGGDPADAVHLLVRQRSAIMKTELWSGLERWLQRLPASVSREPHLQILSAWMYQNRGRYPEMIATLDEIEAGLATGPDAAADVQLRGELAALRGYQRISESRPEDAVACAERALSLLPKACLSERGYAAIVLAGAHQMTGSLARARAVVYDALADPRLPTGTAYHSRLLMALGLVYWMEADLPMLAQVGAECLELGEGYDLPESRLIGRYLLGISQYQEDRLVEAEATLGPLMTPAAMANAEFYSHAAFALAAIQQATGDADRAVQTVARLSERLLRTGNTWMLQVAEGCRALLLAQQGQESRAIAWLRGAPPSPMIPQYMFHCPLLVGPRILLAEGSAGSLAEAAERLDTLVPYLRRIHNVRFLVEALGLQAWLLHLRGDAAGARQALGEAVRLALPGGLVRALADLGPALSPLLDGLVADGQLGPFIERIRRAGGRGAARAPVGPETGTAPALTEPLTRREREVLQLLGHRLSNKEIADRLFVSAATVKRHTENLYAKLGVKGRRDAAVQARELGLLDDAR